MTCARNVKLSGCCCPAAVHALWSLQLPVAIRAHISNMSFDHSTYKNVFEAADKVYLSSKQVQISAVTKSLDETLPAFTTQNQPTSEVAAVSSRGRSNRGSGTRGGASRGNRGGQRGARGGRGGSRRGPRHSSSPPETCCDRHYVHGDQAFYCLAPLTCPWVNKIVAPPSK